MYTLKLLIAGIIALVPIYDEDGSATKVWGLFPGTIMGSDIPGYDPEKTYSRHYPAVIVPAQHVVGQPIPRLPGSTTRPEGAEARAVVFLEQESVRIETSDRDRRVLSLAPFPKKELPDSKSEERKYLWVIRMNRASPEHAQVEAGMLDETVPQKLLDSPTRLAARVELDVGHLRTETVVKSDGQPVLFQMNDIACKEQDAYCQAADEVTALELQGLRDPVTLVFTHLASGAETRRIVIYPLQPQLEPLEVEIVHETARALLGMKPTATDALTAEDYRWFHFLSANQENGFAMPIIPKGLGFGDPFCTKTLMQAYE